MQDQSSTRSCTKTNTCSPIAISILHTNASWNALVSAGSVSESDSAESRYTSGAPFRRNVILPRRSPSTEQTTSPESASIEAMRTQRLIEWVVASERNRISASESCQLWKIRNSFTVFELTFLGSIEDVGLRAATYCAIKLGYPIHRILSNVKALREAKLATTIPT